MPEVSKRKVVCHSQKQANISYAIGNQDSDYALVKNSDWKGVEVAKLLLMISWLHMAHIWSVYFCVCMFTENYVYIPDT